MGVGSAHRVDATADGDLRLISGWRFQKPLHHALLALNAAAAARSAAVIAVVNMKAFIAGPRDATGWGRLTSRQFKKNTTSRTSCHSGTKGRRPRIDGLPSWGVFTFFKALLKTFREMLLLEAAGLSRHGTGRGGGRGGLNEHMEKREPCAQAITQGTPPRRHGLCALKQP